MILSSEISPLPPNLVNYLPSSCRHSTSAGHSLLILHCGVWNFSFSFFKPAIAFPSVLSTLQSVAVLLPCILSSHLFSHLNSPIPLFKLHIHMFNVFLSLHSQSMASRQWSGGADPIRISGVLNGVYSIITIIIIDANIMG